MYTQLLNIYECNYINIIIFNMCTICIELERNFLSSSVTILHHIKPFGNEERNEKE